MKSYCIDHSHVINDKDDSSMKTSQPLILGSFLESLYQNCTDVRPRILRILEKSSRMNLYRFLSVCRPDNDPIDCPRFKNKSNDQTYPFEPIYNFIINTLHYSYKQHTFVKMTSGC